MNRNVLKLIACVSMLLDHMGILLFPHFVIFRWCGRIALPLFAFFIGEGCRYTSNRKKYILSLFTLAAVCQAAYIAQALFFGGGLHRSSDCWYLNTVFALTLAALLCCAVLDTEEAFRRRDARAKRKSAALLAVLLAAVAAGAVGFAALRRRGWSLQLDYGVYAVLLPVGAVLFRERRAKLCCYALFVAAYCVGYMGDMPYVWFSLLSLPLLAAYNGNGGSRRLKYAFYVFYPAHLGALYLIGLLL